MAFLLVTFSWLFRGPLLSRKTVFGPFSLLFRGFFVAFSWLFRGARFGQILRVLAPEQSSDFFSYFQDSGVFFGTVPPQQDRNSRRANPENNFDNPHTPY